jgi:hypothetical protein
MVSNQSKQHQHVGMLVEPSVKCTPWDGADIVAVEGDIYTVTKGGLTWNLKRGVDRFGTKRRFDPETDGRW